MRISVNTPCPSDETLALFATGDIDVSTRHQVLAHVETCSDCMAAFLSAHVHLQEERSTTTQRSDWRWWMAAAAAVIIAILMVPLLLRQRDPMGRMIALAPVSERIVEPRLSGGFAWAPYHGPARGADTAPSVGRLKLNGAAGEVLERAEDDHSAEAQHAAGVAMVLIERPAEAAKKLEALTSEDATAWNDLAAARYLEALQSRQPAQFQRALAAADQALRVDPRSTEALFNRALILDRVGAAAEARRAWGRYLEVDGSSRWADEARGHLAQSH